MKYLPVILHIVLTFPISLKILAQSPVEPNLDNFPIEFLISDLITQAPKEATILGAPKLIETPFGKAVLFNGVDDGIFLDYTPLLNLPNFTVEVIIRPDANGLAEQRFLHLGKMYGERIMLETRLTGDGSWYVDGYVQSNGSKLILIDSTKLHPLNKWYNVTMVNENGNVGVFINGKKELAGKLPFVPFKEGKSSIGVRQNKVYWYKGAIHKIRITPEALKPDVFLSFD